MPSQLWNAVMKRKGFIIPLSLCSKITITASNFSGPYLCQYWSVDNNFFTEIVIMMPKTICMIKACRDEEGKKTLCIIVA
jgi:hypothetical protein